MRSVSSLARATMAPSPTPGNTKTLFACPITRACPSDSTGAKGLPVATSALPAVQASTSAGVASELAVGLESGSTMGLGVMAAISRTASSVKAPALALVPTRMVGSHAAHDGLQVVVLSRLEAEA